MKNKKLFAILTLVCFMFTLMPVAAFAAPTDFIAADQYTFDSNQVYVTTNGAATITTEDNTELVLTNPNAGFWAFVGSAVTTGTSVTDSGYVFYVVSEAGEYVDITTSGQFSTELKLPGDYEVHAIKLPGTANPTKVADILTDVDSVEAKVNAFKAYAGSANVVEGFATVTYDAPEMVYRIVLAQDRTAKTGSLTNSTVNTTTTGVYDMDIEASEGWNKDGGVVATLSYATKALYDAAPNKDIFKATDSNWTPVKAGYELKIETAGYVDVSASELKTNNMGKASFVVTTDLANQGNKVIVKFGNKAKATLTVDARSAAVANIAVVNEPVAPQNNENTVEKANIEFKFTDANGVPAELSMTSNRVNTTNVAGTDGVVNLDASQIAIILVEKPAKSTLKANDFGLEKQCEVTGSVAADAAGVYTLVLNDNAGVADKDGKYVVKVAMKNGASATATFTVAEMGDIVKIMFVKAPKTVAYGEAVTGAPAFAVAGMDANGVMDTNIAGSASYSASGLAVDNFNMGMLQIKDDDKYIGETVTVLAKYDDFIATTDIKVVDKAATVAYLSTEAEVGVSTTLVGQIKDASGKVTPITTTVTGVDFIIQEKPENAVAVATSVYGDNLKDGNVVMNFMASQAGEYKVQTIVTYLVGGATKYISGTETFTVGGGKTVFNDVIVMSIGANSLVKNSEVIAMPAAPEIVDSRTMVPARAGLEAFGATVVWDEATQTVTAELNGVKVVMTIGEKVYTVNGVAKTGDAAPYITAASTMVPVSFFTNAFGIEATPIYDDHGVCDVMFAK